MNNWRAMPDGKAYVNIDMARPYTIVATVIPRDAAFLTSNTDLITYGDYNQVPNNLRVFISGGKLYFTNGQNFEKTTDTLTTYDPFVLGVQVTDTGRPKLFVNGVEKTMTSDGASGTITGLTILTKTLFFGTVALFNSKDTWYDNIRVCKGLISGDGQLYGYRGQYVKPVSVTYGFRIDDDESVQLVKIKGSGNDALVANNPAPMADDGTNSLGTTYGASADVVSQWSNKP
eukprot:jgi/Mesvir1/4204/Mv22618-RA.1